MRRYRNHEDTLMIVRKKKKEKKRKSMKKKDSKLSILNYNFKVNENYSQALVFIIKYFVESENYS